MQRCVLTLPQVAVSQGEVSAGTQQPSNTVSAGSEPSGTAPQQAALTGVSHSLQHSLPCRSQGCRQDTAAQRQLGAHLSPSGRLHLSQPLAPWKVGNHPHRFLGENERHREGAKQQLHSWPLVSPQMRSQVWERPQRPLWKGSSLPSEEAQGPGLFSARLTVGGPGLGSSPAWMVNRTCPLASPATSADTYQDWLSAAWSTGLSAQPCHGHGLPLCRLGA